MLPSPERPWGRVVWPGNMAGHISRTEGHMTQRATLEFPGGAAGEHCLGECSPSPSAAELFGARRRMGRSEARGHLRVTMWVTSLQRPGVIETAPTENISRTGIQMVAREFWEPAELVLVSSPPGFCIRGSVVYCKRLPSDEYLLGIGLHAPVEDWAKALGFTKF
jgi:hypothetical protein